ncbi:substrate-binding domain-containing protein [Brevibacillus humidisoli]|uniref:substrate-binding domain-containing protein n=1 Tax=Brevibacillus humidisoli TaxID=2895522 RepID=UPI001E47C711|nr:substrate-binding domain-containing protein [Brevibacillus humidisoli]UFJ42627.1 substrate-binding domain-containing protein [Brevibacillus humidisoli]
MLQPLRERLDDRRSGHRIGSLSHVCVHDLVHESLILTEQGCTYRAFLLRTLSENRIPFQITFEFGSLDAIKQCVMHGWGIALLPRFAVEAESANGSVIAIPFHHPTSDFATQVIYLQNKWLPKAFRLLLQWVSAPSLSQRMDQR